MKLSCRESPFRLGFSREKGLGPLQCDGERKYIRMEDEGLELELRPGLEDNVLW